MKRKLLMSSPVHFAVVYKINPWMDPANAVASRNAHDEWNQLAEAYKELELIVDFIDQVEGLPDMVFTANGFFCIDGKAILARFRFRERQGETEHFKNWLTENKYSVIDPGKVAYEGEGDTFLVKNTIFQGWGFRSDRKIVNLLSKEFPGKNVVPLHLVDERFYHLDTCFFPANEEIVYYYDKAFSKNSVKVIKASFKYPVAVSDEEALSFALNSLATDHTIVTNTKAKKFAERMKSDGFRVVQIPMDEFLKSGGSVKCLTNEIWEA